jgi:hypothetical protein
MSFLANVAFQRRFVTALNANADFATQTRWFDGSVQLEVDDDRLWLKIYRGRVIDHATATPPFGYTFKFSGPESAWKQLVSGKRQWADLTYPGKRSFEDDPGLARLGALDVAIRTEGNLIESMRMTEAMFLLAYTLKAAARR